MGKKVIREEPMGNSPAIKVIYEDGTWGIRMNPNPNASEPPSRVDQIVKELIPRTDKIERLKSLENPPRPENSERRHEAEALEKYVNEIPGRSSYPAVFSREEKIKRLKEIEEWLRSGKKP